MKKRMLSWTLSILMMLEVFTSGLSIATVYAEGAETHEHSHEVTGTGEYEYLEPNNDGAGQWTATQPRCKASDNGEHSWSSADQKDFGGVQYRIWSCTNHKEEQIASVANGISDNVNADGTPDAENPDGITSENPTTEPGQTQQTKTIHCDVQRRQRIAETVEEPEVKECEKSFDGHHHWKEGTVTTPASCTKKGEKTFTCQDCGKERTEELPLVAHTPQIVPGRPATETETGLTDGEVCAICGAVLKAQEVIPKLEKKEEPAKPEPKPEKQNEPEKQTTVQEKPAQTRPEEQLAPAVMPTTTEQPKAQVQPTIPQTQPTPVMRFRGTGSAALPCFHLGTIVTDQAVAATCTRRGLTAGSHCSMCGEILKRQETIPMTLHTPVSAKKLDASASALQMVCAVCRTDLTSTVWSGIGVENFKQVDPSGSDGLLVSLIGHSSASASMLNADVYTNQIGGDNGVPVTQGVHILMADPDPVSRSSDNGTDNSGSRIELKSTNDPISAVQILPMSDPTGGLIEYNIGNNEEGLESFAIDLKNDEKGSSLRVQENGEDVAVNLMGVVRNEYGRDQAILSTESGGQLVFASSSAVFTRQDITEYADGTEVVTSRITPVYSGSSSGYIGQTSGSSNTSGSSSSHTGQTSGSSNTSGSSSNHTGQTSGPLIIGPSPSNENPESQNSNSIIYCPGKNGTGKKLRVIKWKQQPVAIADALYTREGYTQTGWSRKENGEKEVDLGVLYDLDADITLYPSWEKTAPDTCEVRFVPGADGNGPEQTLTKTNGTDLFLPDALFTRDGYIQVGWAITDGGNYAYDLQGKYTEDAPLTLYPVWAPEKIQIVFETRTIEDTSAEKAVTKVQDEKDPEIADAEDKKEVRIIIPFKDPEESTSLVDTVKAYSADNEKKTGAGFSKEDNATNPDGTPKSADDYYCDGLESKGEHKWRNKNGYCSCKKCGKTDKHKYIPDLRHQCYRCGDAGKCSRLTDVYGYVEAAGSRVGQPKLNRKCGVCGSICDHYGDCKKKNGSTHYCNNCGAENPHNWEVEYKNNKMVIKKYKKNKKKCYHCGYKAKY